jgi:hypothetical protein
VPNDGNNETEATERAESPADEPTTPTAPATDAGAEEPKTITLTTTQLGTAAGIAAVAVLLLVVVVVFAVRSGDDGDDELVAGGDGAVATEGADDASTSADAGRRAWPAEVGGRPPAFGARETPPPALTDAEPGVYLWNDFDGWHLWVVQGPGTDRITGFITSSAKATKAVAALPGDTSSGIAMDGRTIVVDFGPSDAPVVGVDFNPGFRVESLAIDLTNGGEALGPGVLRLGSRAVPREVPYTLRVEAR